MKIIVTGANGYLGSRICLYLANKGYSVVANVRSKIPQKKGWTEKISKFIVGDITKEKIIKEIAKEKASVIIHLVSLDHHDSEKDPIFSSNVNVLPVWKMLNSCKSKGLKKFIYFSTIHVYGNSKNQLFSEHNNLNPKNIYGLTHSLSEQIVNFYNKNSKIDCINIRLSNSYGEPIFHESKSWNLVVNDLVKSAFNNKKIILRGDGKAVRDFIHYSDICSGIQSVITKKNINHNIFHFSSFKSISMLDLALEIRNVYHERYFIKLPIFINVNDEINTDKNIKEHNYVSNELAKKILNIEFNKELNDGINDMFNYLEKIDGKS